MDPQSAALLAKDIGAGLATIGVAGAGVGIGNLLGVTRRRATRCSVTCCSASR